ncbi:5-formyltetrahydrofolate cyclo-ligase [Sulfurimonas diazotrophicus]|uniref:5-formyltetrahydrofolate cyclo-ligase n=1 Tax=Sulfurimonas diazotrophicus TaxID=3131939 RepID=A0ABZ3HEA0_9BACT
MTKAAFRDICLNKQRSVWEHNRLERDKRLCDALYAEVRTSGGKDILLFWPLGSEPDLRPLLHRLRREGWNVYLPFMVGASFLMVPFRYPMFRKNFGIYEPGFSNRNIKKIDIAVVPAVGVDAQARRIGFGKGMYDRFFARLNRKPKTIFVQLEECMTNEKICDDYDVSADVLLTPSARYEAAGTIHDKRNTLRRRDRHY